MENPFHRFVGGRLCLDFVNTVRGRASAPGVGGRNDYLDRVIGDRLVTYDALLAWGTLTGVLTEEQHRTLKRRAGHRPREGAKVLARATALREAVHRLVKAGIEQWAPEANDLACFNAELRLARSRERLVASPAFALAWDDDSAALDRVLWPVAASAAELLASPDLERVGQCPGDQCGWMFLDTSRSGRRQWCHMGDCGTLAKVRRFRQKRQQAEA
jgi:predicted RNA-binding Zn ribbon-like protein